jgi:hypothetical protein
MGRGNGLPITVLLACVQAGSRRAFDELYFRFEPLIHSTANRRSFRRWRNRGGTPSPVDLSFSGWNISRDDRDELFSCLCQEFTKKTLGYEGVRRYFPKYIRECLEWKAINWWKIWVRSTSKTVFLADIAFDSFDDNDNNDDLPDFVTTNQLGLQPLHGQDKDDFYEQVELSDLHRRILQIARRVSEKFEYRTFIIAELYYVHGWSQNQIAEALRYKSRTSVEVQLRRVQTDLMKDPAIRQMAQDRGLGIEGTEDPD